MAAKRESSDSIDENLVMEQFTDYDKENIRKLCELLEDKDARGHHCLPNSEKVEIYVESLRKAVKKIEDLETEISTKDKKFENEKTELMARIGNPTAENKDQKFEEKIKEMQAENENLKKEVTNIKEKYTKMKEKLQADNEKIKNDCAVNKDKYKKTKKELNAKNEILINQKVADNEKSESTIRELKTIIENLKAENSKNQAKGPLTQQISGSNYIYNYPKEKEEDDQKSNIKDLQTQLEQSAKTIGERDLTIRNCETQSKKDNLKYDEIKKQLSDKVVEISSLKEKNRTLKQNNIEMDQKLKKLESKLAASDQELRDKVSEISKLTNDLNEAKRDQNSSHPYPESLSSIND